MAGKYGSHYTVSGIPRSDWVNQVVAVALAENGFENRFAVKEVNAVAKGPVAEGALLGGGLPKPLVMIPLERAMLVFSDLKEQCEADEKTTATVTGTPK